MKRKWKVSLASVGAALALTVSSCGLGTAGGFSPTGDLAGELEGIDLSGARVAVGSKNFTEQFVLGKMMVILLQSSGANVRDLTNIPGSTSMRQAQVTGQIHVVSEYTGTAWIAYMGNDEPIPDEQAQYEAVRDADLAENDLVWLEPAPLNNTYGFAVQREKLEELGITKLSELPNVPVEERTFCVDAEFRNRSDGLEPMLETYGVPIGSETPGDQIYTFDTGAIYTATATGECNFGEVFLTDGRIAALDLVPLEDDRNYFPKYNAAPVIVGDLYREYPEIEELFAPVWAGLTDEVMVELNGQVDVDGREPTDVAWDYLIEEGFVTPRGE